MKPLSKIFTLFFFISIFVFPNISLAQLIATPLTATVTGTVITATLTGVPVTNIEKVNILVGTSNFPPSGTLCTAGLSVRPCIDPQPTKTVSGTTIKWVIKDRIAGETLYNIRAEGKDGYAFISNVVQVKTGMETIDAKWPLGSTTDGRNAWIFGKINNPNPGDFTTVELEYSVTNLPVNGSAVAGTKGPIKAQKTDTANSALGVNADGTYFYRLIDLTPSQTYSIRQTIKSKNGALQIKVGSFNASKGITPENSAETAKSDAQRSYSLLAPLPGLSVVLDNDLCREYVTQGKPVPGGSCDNQISWFINLLIRFLIGLSVVVLVVKIIFEGYQYMVTDIPFIKANAKSKLFESFFGLLLAMSSYLILNTINPRLINGGVSIANLDLSIEEDENEIIRDDRFTQNTTTRTNKNCKGKIVDIKTGNGSYMDVCDEISSKVELMFSDAKKAGIVLSGGGYRTYQEQAKLYNDNCGGGSSRCDPPTARPGSSMHETGKAFDLKCDGSLITFSTPFKGVRTASTRRCFDWLTQNAYKYGLQNLKKENWHWSVNGK